MKIVVDTNIIFSVLLNTSGTIGDLLFKSKDTFRFYSCAYMRQEMDKHWDKLLALSKLNESQLREIHFQVLQKIHFINEDSIPEKIWLSAEKIAKDIDIDDSDFIALTTYLRGYLWTGDRPLAKGLKKAGFKNVYTTAELAAIRKGL